MIGLAEYLTLGFRHITDAAALDHLLFLTALVAPYRLRDWRHLVSVTAAFTAGHSLTLALAATDVLRFPAPLVEFLIPVTIVLAAFGNLRHLSDPPTGAARAALAGVFGLVHGAGFATFLRSLFDGPIALPLLGFNLGIELGQLAVLAVALVAFAAVDRILADRLSGAARRLRALTASLVAATWALVILVERTPW